MSHSNIIKIKTLTHENDSFSFEPINENNYEANGFLDGFHDYVATVDKEEEAEVIKWLKDYSVFTNDGLVDDIYRGHVNKTDLENWINEYRERIDNALYDAFHNDAGIQTYTLEQVINPASGIYVEDRWGSYHSLPQFLLDLYNNMIRNKVDVIYCVYEGVLDYHC